MTKRTVQITTGFMAGTPFPELSVYQPGTVEQATMKPMTIYGGTITELAVFPTIRGNHLLDIWIENEQMERFLLLRGIRFLPSTKRVDVLEQLTGGKPISISSTSALGATLTTFDRRLPEDALAIVGYAEEVGIPMTTGQSSAPGGNDGPVISTTPPEDDSKTWIQTNEFGIVIDRWQLATDGQTWVSQEERFLGYQTNGTPPLNHDDDNPLWSAACWVDQLIVGLNVETAWAASDDIEYRLFSVPAGGGQDNFFSHTISELPVGFFQAAIPVGESVSNCQGFKLKAFTGGSPTASFCNYQIRLRRIYQP